MHYSISNKDKYLNYLNKNNSTKPGITNDFWLASNLGFDWNEDSIRRLNTKKLNFGHWEEDKHWLQEDIIKHLKKQANNTNMLRFSNTLKELAKINDVSAKNEVYNELLGLFNLLNSTYLKNIKLLTKEEVKDYRIYVINRIKNKLKELSILTNLYFNNNDYNYLTVKNLLNNDWIKKYILFLNLTKLIADKLSDLKLEDADLMFKENFIEDINNLITAGLINIDSYKNLKQKLKNKTINFFSSESLMLYQEDFSFLINLKVNKTNNPLIASLQYFNPFSLLEDDLFNNIKKVLEERNEHRTIPFYLSE